MIYRDPLADLEWDEECTPAQPVVNDTPTHTAERWAFKYQHEQYNWNAFKAPYVVVPLSKGYFAVIDSCDAKRVLKRSWCVTMTKDKDGNITSMYAVSRVPKRERRPGQSTRLYLHRFIARAPSSVLVDHCNGEGLDNRRLNLRLVTQSQNIGNATRPPRKRAYPRGVVPIIYTTKAGERRLYGYKGCITVNGRKRRTRRLFATPERAHRWYRKACDFYYGDRSNWESNPSIQPPEFPPILGYEDVPF